MNRGTGGLILKTMASGTGRPSPCFRRAQITGMPSKSRGFSACFLKGCQRHLWLKFVLTIIRFRKYPVQAWYECTERCASICTPPLYRGIAHKSFAHALNEQKTESPPRRKLLFRYYNHSFQKRPVYNTNRSTLPVCICARRPRVQVCEFASKQAEKKHTTDTRICTSDTRNIPYKRHSSSLRTARHK